MVCPGYAKEFRWSDKHEFHQKPARTMPQPAKHSRAETADQDVIVEVIFSSSPHPTSEVQSEVPNPILRDPLEQHYYSAALPPSPKQSFAKSQAKALFAAGEQNTDTDELPWPHHSPYISPGLDAQQWTHLSSWVPDGESLIDIMPLDPTISEEDTPSVAIDESDAQQETDSFDLQIAPCSDSGVPTDSQTAQSSAQLLRWFYRISPEHYSNTDLVEHYFGQVCRLYAIFDSTKNPFRTLVGSNWDSVESISLAIQSMAYGHLANNDRTLTRYGYQKQQEAYTKIKEDLQRFRAGKIGAERILLAVILLGTTAAWHNENDIGLQYLDIARELIRSKLSQTDRNPNVNAQSLDHFFLQAMVYYEMLLALVDGPVDPEHTEEDALPTLLQSLSFNGGMTTINQEASIRPHPWTGISPRIQILFAEAGRIIRKHITRGGPPTARDRIWAAAIEESLMTATLPTDCAIIDDTEDQNTPRDHFLRLAEAYRCAGLLQIYHVFPDVLHERLARARDNDAANDCAPPVVSPDDMRRYRTDLAIHVLNLVRSMSIWSGASCLHPILILTAGSELRYYSSSSSSSPCLSSSWPSLSQQDFPTFTQSADDDGGVFLARAFAEERLSALAARLPRKPYLRMLQILRETWLQMDLLEMEVHWMQVMHEKKWETIMG